MIRTTPLAFSIALGLLAPLSHAAAIEHFSRSLAGLPASVFTGMESATFVDLAAVAEVSAKDSIPLKASQRGSLGMEWPIYQVLAMATAEALHGSTGLRAAQLQFLTAVGTRPEQTLMWGLAAEAGALVSASLANAGFSQHGTSTQLWSNGELGQMNLGAPKTPNPWRWPMGEASLVTLSHGVLYQSQTEAALQAALQQPSALESVAGQALKEVYGQARITQAMLFSAAIGTSINGSAPDGQPPYLGAMLADLASPGGASAVLAFVYDDCQKARTSRDVLQAQWHASTPARPEFTVVESATACLATVALKDPQPIAAGNQAFFALFSALMRRQLPALAAE